MKSAGLLLAPDRLPYRLPIVLLAAGLAYAVLNEGGRAPVEWYAALVWMSLVAAYCWLRTPAAELAPALPSGLSWLVALAPALVAFQLVPLPVGLLRVLSPERAALVDGLGAVMPPPTFAPLSIDPAATQAALVNVAACAVTFLLVRELAWRARAARSWAPVVPLLAVAVVEAAIGYAQAQSGVAAATGTFHSKNHFAGFLEMSLPLAVACACGLVWEGHRMGRLGGLRLLSACGALAAAAAIMAGLIQSVSKMGAVAGLAGLLAVGLLALFARTRPGRARWLGAAAIAACAVVAIVLLPTGRVLGAFAYLASNDMDDARWPVWVDTLRLVREYPAFGTGLGTYGTAFLKHQSAFVELAFTYAHNDYLQLAAEAGAAGVVVFVGILAAVFAAVVAAALGGPDWYTRALAMGCAGSLVAIGVHSAADFNMEIPANALLLSWIAGIAASLSWRAWSQGRYARLGFRAASVAAAALLVGFVPSRMVREVSAHERSASDAGRTLPELQAALRREPASPERWCNLGAALAREGRLDQARVAFASALGLAPGIPPVALRAADFHFDRGEDREALALTRQVLDRTDGFDLDVFTRYEVRKVPAARAIEAGLPAAPRAANAYLRYLSRADDAAGAEAVWQWLASRRAVEKDAAVDYVNVRLRTGGDLAAADAWRQFVGAEAADPVDGNAVLNGSFERDPEPASPFEWQLGSARGVVSADIDPFVARAGRRSLRLRFFGEDNIAYDRTWTTAVLPPGRYRVQAQLRADGVTTERGVALRISARGGVNAVTPAVNGTVDWTEVEATFTVSDRPAQVTLAAVRAKSLKFDNRIRGTVWIDSVAIVPLAPPPS